MRLRVVAASVVVLLLGGALATSTAEAATSPRPPLSGWTIEGAAGSSFLTSGYREFSDVAATSFVGPDTLVLDGPPEGWQLVVAAPTGGHLAVGSYQTAGSADATTARLAMFGPAQDCGDETGTLVVHEIARDAATQAITSFAGSYSVSCHGAAVATVGELRYGSTVDYARFGASPLGANPAPQTVKVTAKKSTTFAAAYLEGLDADQWSIQADSCSGSTVAAGAPCSVTLASHLSREGGLVADLRIPSDRGDRVVGLTAVGVNTAEGTFTPVPPLRLLDTRTGLGAPKAPVGSGREIDVTIAGRASVPVTGASSVVLNLSVVSPTLPGYLTLYPSGATRPLAASINFPAKWTGANLVTVPLGSDGHLRVFNAVGSTNVVADVLGYYSSAASTLDPTAARLADYVSVKPFRLVDTRTDGGGPLPANYYLLQGINYGAEFNQRIIAMAVNVTVVSPGAAGYLTTWDGVTDAPKTSTLNFLRGQVVGNMATIRVGRCSSDCNSSTSLPSIGILNASTAASHIIVDVVGIYFQGEEGDRGWRYHSLTTPTRFVDSREGLGLASAVGPRSSQPVLAPASVAGDNTYAIVSNVTAVRPTAPTYLTLWRNDGTAVPTVSNVNATTGQVVANMAITQVWTHNDFRVYNSAGTTDLTVDAAGTMELYPARRPAATGAGSSRAATTVVPPLRGLPTPGVHAQ